VRDQIWPVSLIPVQNDVLPLKANLFIERNIMKINPNTIAFAVIILIVLWVTGFGSLFGIL
jgi:hypothetical protein